LIKIFKRALNANDAFKVYKLMIELHKNKGDWNMVSQLSKAMAKKFKNMKESWKFYLTNEIQRQKAEG